MTFALWAVLTRGKRIGDSNRHEVESGAFVFSHDDRLKIIGQHVFVEAHLMNGYLELVLGQDIFQPLLNITVELVGVASVLSGQ